MVDISVIIQARMGSTRLPGKVLKDISGRPVLWHVINRIKKSKYISKIIVATTDNKEDIKIYEYCNKNNINVFRGSSEDVLDRYYKCAKEYDCKNIVRITADCPLHDALVIDKVVESYLEKKYDYVSNTFKYTYPDGLDTEIFSFNVLKDAWENAKLLSEREHVTPYIRKNSKYRKSNILADKKYPVYRLTLDYDEDYNFIKSIYKGIGKLDFSLDDVIEFLNKNLELLRLNGNYKINEGYEKSLKEDKIVKF